MLLETTRKRTWTRYLRATKAVVEVKAMSPAHPLPRAALGRVLGVSLPIPQAAGRCHSAMEKKASGLSRREVGTEEVACRDGYSGSWNGRLYIIATMFSMGSLHPASSGEISRIQLPPKASFHSPF